MARKKSNKETRALAKMLCKNPAFRDVVAEAFRKFAASGGGNDERVVIMVTIVDGEKTPVPNGVGIDFFHLSDLSE